MCNFSPLRMYTTIYSACWITRIESLIGWIICWRTHLTVSNIVIITNRYVYIHLKYWYFYLSKVAYFFESWVLYVEEWCGCKMARRHVGLPGYGRDLLRDRVAVSEFSLNHEFWVGWICGHGTSLRKNEQTDCWQWYSNGFLTWY